MALQKKEVVCVSNLESDVSEEKLKELKKSCSDLLTQDRQRLLIKHPFVGGILMGLDLIPIRDARCRTAATDASKIFIDIAFWSELSPENRTFVLAHEVWHCALMHFARRQGRDPEVFNWATDMEINTLLRNDGLNPPAEVLFPPSELEGHSAEEIYEHLLKQMKKNQSGKKGQKSQNGKGSSQSQQSQPGNGGGDPFDGDGEDGQEDSDNNGKGKPNGGKDGKEKNGGNKNGKLEGQFDRHEYKDLSDMTEEELKEWLEKNQPKDKYGKVGFDKDFNPSISQDAQEKMRQSVIQAAQSHERQKGDLPAHMKALLDQLLQPEVKWQEVLAQFVTKCYGIGRKTWCPPNRRHIHNDTYIQSRRTEKIKLAVCVDTSGSCLGDLPKFFGELKGLVESFGEYEIHLIQCDAEVGSCEFYDEGNPLDIEKNFEMTGGGGTSFSPCYDYIKENGIDCDAVIYLTDGYGDVYPNNPLSVPTLWVITSDGSEEFCNWGQKIKFKSDYKKSYDWN